MNVAVPSIAVGVLALAAVVWPEHRPVHRLRRPQEPAAAPVSARAGPLGARLPLPVLGAGVAGAVAAAVSTPLVAGVAGLLGGLAARAWVIARRASADEARIDALIQALGALVADLRAGRSVESAAGTAAAGAGDRTTRRALVQALRAPEHPVAESGVLTEPLARVAAAVRLSGRTGCSLADVLTVVEDDLRARRRAALELRSATAGPRAGALLLAGLPVLGLAMGSGVGADPWRVLTTTGTGQLLLVAGVGLEVAGVVWSGRLVRRALR